MRTLTAAHTILFLTEMREPAASNKPRTFWFVIDFRILHMVPRVNLQMVFLNRRPPTLICVASGANRHKPTDLSVYTPLCAPQEVARTLSASPPST